MLAPRLRKGELVLTPEQEPQFRRLTAAVAPALKEMARLSQLARAAESERQAGQVLLERLQVQRGERLGAAGVAIGALAGEVQVLALGYEPDAGNAWDLPAREIKTRLREATGAELLHAGSEGAWSWSTDPAHAVPAIADVFVY